MEKLSAVLFILFIASCTTGDQNFSQSEKHNIKKLALSYYGARNDLQGPQSTELETTFKISETLPESFSLISLPLTYAIYCDEEKLDCRHAAVKSTLKFTVNVSQGGQKEIQGHFLSEMGRSVTFRSPLAESSGQYSTLSVPEGVPVIASDGSKSPFKMLVLTGNTIEIKGIAG